MQDSEIIRLYWARREEAIQESQLKYGAYCRTIAERILQNREDTEECVSDTWLHAWGAMPPQRPTILRAFFGRITRNLALNVFEHIHAEKRGGARAQMTLALSELSELIADGSPADAEERMVFHDTLQRFLSELRKEERVMFLQRYWYFCPVKEIAAELGCGQSRVKMSLLRMRGRLREMLEEEGIVL